MLPIITPSVDARYTNADKMIMKGALVLPHGLFNSVAKLGQKGEKLIEYIEWLRDRVQKFAPHKDYHPIFHIDCYGTIGMVFGPSNYADMAVFLKKAVEAAKPFHLRIEGPMDSDGREAQMRDLAGLTAEEDYRGIDFELVADEWCNTYEDVRAFVDAGAGHMIQIKSPDLGSLHKSAEAVLYCQQKGVSAYLGGTCYETSRSAEVCVHIAMATKPSQILAKPGMGVDEGIMIAYNEMQRILALRK